MSLALRPRLLAFALALASTGPALAGGLREGSVIVAQMSDDDMGNVPEAEPQNSPAAQSVRIDRLESTIRTLTGQIEQLQFQNRKLSEDLRKMQGDIDFRFQDLNRGSGSALPAKPAAPLQKSDAGPVPSSAGLPQDASGSDQTGPDGTGVALRPTRRAGDAFDPDTNPAAPGAPKPLGTTPASAPLNTRPAPSTPVASSNTAPNAPLDLMKRPAADPSSAGGVASMPPAVAPSNPGAVASLVPGGTRDEYNGDLDLYRQGQYDGAASGLKSFIEKYPRDRLLPDAVYLLGETYSKMGRHREAAEQYLRLSTDFSKAPRAPDALLRLGMSLNAMGVREQACATYQEVTRRFPTASTDVRAAVDRELKRARC